VRPGSHCAESPLEHGNSPADTLGDDQLKACLFWNPGKHPRAELVPCPRARTTVSHPGATNPPAHPVLKVLLLSSTCTCRPGAHLRLDSSSSRMVITLAASMLVDVMLDGAPLQAVDAGARFALKLSGASVRVVEEAIHWLRGRCHAMAVVASPSLHRSSRQKYPDNTWFWESMRESTRRRLRSCR
jgi:hypothetical protein